MRIAYIDPHPVPDATPESLQILQTVDALAAQGVTVDLLCAPAESSAEAILGRTSHPGLRMIHAPAWHRRVPLFKRSTKLFSWWALRWLRHARVDVIYLRNIKLAEFLLRRGVTAPIVFEAHEIFARTYQDEHPQPARREAGKLAVLRARERYVYSRVQGVAALTALLAEDLREEYGIAQAHFCVAPDGVDIDTAQRDAVLSPPAAGVPPCVLYLGSLHVWKGVELAISAMPEVPEARLRIVGGGTARIRELQAQAEQLGVADRVELPGAVAPAKRFAEIAVADICVLPLADFTIGLRHTSPLKLFEYMAMGKAIVAADVPSIREVLTQGEHGLLFPVGDASALAAALRTLLGDAGLRQRLGQNAAQHARHYSWHARAETLVALCKRLLSTAGQKEKKTP